MVRLHLGATATKHPRQKQQLQQIDQLKNNIVMVASFVCAESSAEINHVFTALSMFDQDCNRRWPVEVRVNSTLRPFAMFEAMSYVVADYKRKATLRRTLGHFQKLARAMVLLQ